MQSKPKNNQLITIKCMNCDIFVPIWKSIFETNGKNCELCGKPMKVIKYNLFRKEKRNEKNR